MLKAIYHAVCGMLQTATGPLSGPLGPQGLIDAGIWTQATGLFLTAATRSFAWWFLASVLLGLSTARPFVENARTGAASTTVVCLMWLDADSRPLRSPPLVAVRSGARPRFWRLRV